jgi:hypothetical protein
MYYPAHNKHFWTTDNLEKTKLVNGAGFRYEGAVHMNACDTGTAVMRLVHPAGKHFWTTSVPEANYLRSVGFKLEGTAFKACNDKSQPVYRLYNRTHNKHLWTSNAAERDWLATRGFTYEGIVW